MTDEMQTNRRRWRRHIDRIRSEQIEPLLWNVTVFRAFQASTRIRGGTTAHDLADWMAQNYMSATAAAVRRAVEPKGDRPKKLRFQSVSLVRLLEELRDTPGAITYARFGLMFRGHPIPERLVRKQWNRNGGGSLQYGSRAIRADLRRLKTATDHIRVVTNKVLAHTAVVTRKREQAWFMEIATAAELLNTLLNKYDLLVFGRSPHAPDLSRESGKMERAFNTMWRSLT